MARKKADPGVDVTKNLQKMLKARKTKNVVVEMGSVRPPRARAIDSSSDYTGYGA